MTGWAIPGVGIRVVDADGRDVRPDGDQIGEIVVRSNTVMDGYYRDAEAPDGSSSAIEPSCAIPIADCSCDVPWA